MSDVSQAGYTREFPGFLNEWEVVGEGNLTPLHFLDDQRGIPFIIAASWLFAPNFVEYRGGVFIANTPDGLTEKYQKRIDEWFDHFDGDIAQVEQLVNRISFSDIFSSCDLEPFGADLFQLATTIAKIWSLLLIAQFPDRSYWVDFYGENESYGAHITFFRYVEAE